MLLVQQHQPARNQWTRATNEHRPADPGGAPASPWPVIQRHLAVVFLLVAALLLSACGTGENHGGNSTPATAISRSPAVSSTVDPQTAAALRAATAAYQGYLAEFARAAQRADPDDPDLARYLADPLLGTTRRSLRAMRDKGEVQLGTQTATVTRAEADLTGGQPSVTIHACLDYSTLRLVYQANRSPVPNSRITHPKVSAVATVWLYKTGQWLVNDSKQGDEPC